MAEQVYFMVPARGGSVGLPRKNMKRLGDHPLIAHALLAIREAASLDRCYVITDSEEIADIARNYGAQALMEERTTGKATLDDVALKVLAQLGDVADDAIFLTVQPTCPFVSPHSIREAVAAFGKGAGSVITCTDDRHLSWNLDAEGQPVPAYAARVNRQDLPAHFRESGAVIGARVGDIRKHGTRIVAPIKLIEISPREALDIDTPADFALAEYYINRKRIVLRADGGPQMGMGHAYRALAMAYELSGHDVTIVTRTDDNDLVARFFVQHPFKLRTVESEQAFLALLRGIRPDITFIDILDTAADFIQSVKATPTKVVTLEDLGDGARYADLVINELYHNSDLPPGKQLSGIRHAILAPAFEAEPPRADASAPVERVLVLFGGTDPSGLTAKALEALAGMGFKGHVDVVRGMGHSHPLPPLESLGLTGTVHENVQYMPGLMKKADIALSSAGRTVTELLSLGVPTVVLCQNAKELTHTHANSAHGALNLGLGSLVDTATLQNHLRFVMDNASYRQHMNALARAALQDRSNRDCLKRFAAAIGEEL